MAGVLGSVVRYAPLGTLAIVGCALTGCGGTEDVVRQEREAYRHTAKSSPLDLTDCEAVAEAYEFLHLENFSAGNSDQGTSGTASLGWYVSHDGTNAAYDFEPTGGTISGSLQDAAPSLAEADLCEQSEYGMKLHSFGEGFKDWGYTLGSNMHMNNDATAWDGLAFWARRGIGTAPIAVKVTVTDQYTMTSSGATNTYCIDGLYDDESCDAFGRAVALSEEWELKLIRFDEMYQEGFGLRTGYVDDAGVPRGTPELNGLLGISFLVGKGTWEVWLDEVAYFREKN